MRGRVGLGVVGLMARSAGRRFPVVDAIGVTRLAVRGLMRARQREAGGVVVERPTGPRRGRVAGGARRREPRGLVGGRGGLGEVALMTRYARGRLADVDAVGVTGLACGGLMGAGERERRGRVVEPATLPRRRRMAVRASARKAGGLMRRRGRLGELLLMARGTGGRLPDVHPVDVTGLAGRGLMRAGQGKLGARVVIERGAKPPGGGMAVGAGGRKTGRRMRWRLGVGERELMARNAGGRLPIVDAIRVALLAGRRQMGAGQLELRPGVVVDASAFPGRGRMASRAVVRKPSVGRLVGLLGIGLVTGHAGGRPPVVGAIRVATLATRGLMGAGQPELRDVVVERAALPGHVAMAARAGTRELGRAVVRADRPVEVGSMAGHAVERRSSKHHRAFGARGVTLGAVDRAVRSLQGKPGQGMSLEERGPVVERPGVVTAGAVEAQFTLVDVLMARGAGRGDLGEIERLVATRATDPGMSILKWKAIVRVPERRLDGRRLPGLGGVAGGAGQRELSVGVGVSLLSRHRPPSEHRGGQPDPHGNRPNPDHARPAWPPGPNTPIEGPTDRSGSIGAMPSIVGVAFMFRVPTALTRDVVARTAQWTYAGASRRTRLHQPLGRWNDSFRIGGRLERIGPCHGGETGPP